jgi:MFS family permease
VPDPVDGAVNAAAPIQPLPEPIQRRLMSVLFSSQSIFSAAQIVAFTPLPLAAVYLTGSEAAAGLPSTVTLVGRAIIAYPIGWLMDRLGRRLGVSMGLGTSVIGTLLCAFALVAGSFPLFLMGCLVNGFGRGASEQSRYAAADIRPGAQAAKAIGTIVFAGTIGAVVGPLLIAPAERAADLRGLPALSGPYLLTAALSFVAFALIFLFLRPEPVPVRAARAPGSLPVDEGRTLRTIFADATVQFAVFALAISQLVMVMVMVITPLHMQHEAHSTQSISWVIMAHTLGMFGLSGFTGWLTARYGQVLVIMLAGVTLSVSAIMAPLVHTVPMLALALFLLGLGWNFGFVAGSALLAGAVTGNERGRTQGASETLVAAAAALGSFGSGIAFQWGGMIAVGALGLALAMALLAARLLFRPSARLATANQP